MRYTIHWRYPLTLCVVLAVVAGAVAGVHHWQVGRQTGAFLHQADRAKEAGRAADEALYLRKYLVARPDDADARERLGRLQAADARAEANPARARAAAEDAYVTLNAALTRDPSREELRRFVVEFAMDPSVRMPAEAEGHIDALLLAHPGDGELEAKAGRCLEMAQKYPAAAARLRKAVAARPDLVDPAALLANLLRGRLNQPDEADRVMAGLAKARPDDARAHLATAYYWRQTGRRTQPAAAAAKPLAEALKLPAGETVGGAGARAAAAARRLAPDDVDVLAMAAQDALDRARDAAAAGDRPGYDAAAAEARGLAARAVELHPKVAAVYLRAAAVEDQTGRPAEAAAVARKGLAAFPDATALTAALLDYQVKAGDAAGAADTLAKLRGGRLLSAVGADFHQAQVLALRDDWEGAAKLLAGAVGRGAAEFAARPALAREVYLLYGRCCEQTGEHDRALEAFRKARPDSPADPLWGPANAGEAAAELARGNTDAALAASKRAATGQPAAWAGVARLELLKALQTPAGAKPDWAAAEAALAAADKAAPGATEVALLRAELLNLQGRKADARKLLDRLRADKPKEPAVWAAAATQHLRENDPAAAEKALDAAAAGGVDSADLRLTRARAWAAAKAPDLPARLAGLAAGAEKLGKVQERRLLRDLGDFAAAAGADGLAAQLSDRVAAVHGFSLDTHLRRFDRAAQAGDEAGVAKVLADIKRVDGEGGHTARLAAALALIGKARKAADPAPLEQARDILERLERERPEWGRAVQALADVLLLQKKPAEAAAKYQRAVDAGVNSPEVVRRLMELYTAANRFAEAELLVKKFPPDYAEKPEVQRLLAAALVTDPRQAFDRARRAVPADSKDPADQLWLGQKAWAAGDRTAAESAFRAAVALRPDDPVTRLALVQLLARVGQRAEAEKAAADGAGRVPAAEKALYEATAAAYLGQRERAAEAYKTAREERPADARPVRAEAEFLFAAGSLPEAAAAYRRVVALPGLPAEDKAAATHMLAICLASDRDPETARQALELLGLLDKGALRAPPAGESAAQRKVRIQALALQKEREYKLEAVRLLEEGRAALDPADLFLLYQLYAGVGNPREAGLALTALSEKTKAAPVPLYLTTHADWLLRQNRPDQAAELVGRLAALQPDAFATAELTARVAMARNDPKAARAALVPKADRVTPAAAAAVAAACERVGLADDAERIHRRVYAEVAAADKPAAGYNLAGLLARRGRTADALDLLDRLRPQLPPEAVGATAMTALYAAAAPAPADAARVVGWLEEGLSRPAAPAVKAALTSSLATVKNLQGDYRKAIELYEEVLKLDPKDVAALNNLGYLTAALDRRYDAGLARIELAKRAIGPNPELVDTEAQVLLLAGRPKEAKERLAVAAAEAPAGLKFFHLAQAELALGDRTAARAAWNKSQELGVRAAEVHPLEKKAYDDLAVAFK